MNAGTLQLGVQNAAGPGPWLDARLGPLNAQATLLAGATAAVVDIEVSTDKLGAIATQRLTLSSGTPSDGFVFDEEVSWEWIRMNVVSITNGGSGSVVASARIKQG